LRGSKYFVLFLISLFISPMFFSYVFASDVGVINKDLAPNRIETRTVASSANTTFVSEYDHYFGFPNDFLVHDDLVYVLDRNLGIAIYNLTTFQPELIKYFDKESLIGDFNVPSSYNLKHLYKHETTLIITMGTQGMLLLNITNSLFLDPLCYLEDIDARIVIAKDDFLYILSFGDTIHFKSIFYIFNISNSFLPLEVACYKFEIFYNDLTIQDDFVFFNSDSDGVTILDISVLSSPISVFNLTTDAHNLFVHDNCLILSGMMNDKLQFFNISEIANPIPTTNISVNVDYSSFFSYFDNEFLFVSGGKSYVLNITDISAPSFQSIYNGSFSNLFTAELFSWLNDSKLMLHLQSSNLLIYNYTTFTDYGLITSYYFDSYTKQIELVDNYAFICSGSLLEIISIEDPTSPELISSFRVGGDIEDFVINDDLLLIAADSYGFVVVNITDYSNPTLISHFNPFNWESLSIAYNSKNNVIYLGNMNSLAIINLKDPSNPEVIISISTDRITQIIYDNNYLYVYDIGWDWGLGNLNIFDVSENSNPLKVTSLNIGSHGDIYLENHLLFISSEKSNYTSGYNPLTILEISNPKNPILIYHYNDTWLGVYEFLAYEDILYVCSTQGLLLFDIHFLDSIQIINHTSDMVYPFPNSIAKRGDYLYTSNVWAGLRVYQIEFTFTEITLMFNQYNLITLILVFLVSIIILPIKKKRKKN